MSDFSSASEQRVRHWDAVYEERGTDGVSWFQREPQVSLELVASLAVPCETAVVDVGGGASTFVDRLLARGFVDVTVLDVSAAALEASRRRLGRGARVTWLREDVLTWRPPRRYGLWHDRAAFHFLVDAADRAAYLAVLRSALAPGGQVVLGTFAADGPDRCSGLPVARYSPGGLAGVLGDDLEVVETRREVHVTPAGARQAFTWVAARRVAA